MAKPKSLISVRFPSGSVLEKRIKGLPRDVRRAIKKVVADTGIKAFRRVKFKTPVDRGVRGGAISRWRMKTVNAGRTRIITNDAPHIRVLEFGGYPVTRSGPQKGRFKPGKRTMKAPGGKPRMTSNVSKQAPRGMLRTTFQELEREFTFDLEEAVDRVLAGRTP